jgi:hypothetical protein
MLGFHAVLSHVELATSGKTSLVQVQVITGAAQLVAGADVAAFVGPALPRLGWRDAARRAAGRWSRSAAQHQSRWAASLRMFGETNQRRRHRRTPIVFATACWQTAHVQRWGLCGGVYLCARAARHVSRSLQSITRVGRLGEFPWQARHQECEIQHVAPLPRQTSSAAESRVSCRWRGASAKAWCGQESR